MRISEEKIQEIRDAISIVDVISQFVTLKKSGTSYLGLCPFHTEKTPSFHVDPVRGFFHCFGCGVGGNVFSFVMRMEQLSFPEAIRILAERAGISLPTYGKNEQKEKTTEAVYSTNQFAMKFFCRCLRESKEAEKARRYLAKRGFHQDTIDVFQIGFALNQWDGLLLEAKRVSMQPNILLQAGLVIPKKDGSGYYDRFRGRLMFPVFNPSGRVVGFGGRTIQSEEGPKYLNSPETLLYQKSQILYGLFQTKEGIRRKNCALLVEGYTDLMRLYQCGFDYTVASSGTALTEEQTRLLLRYTRNVILVFDGDSAGYNASIRGIDVLVRTGFYVKIVPLPKGEDPDSFLKKNSRKAMEVLLDSARTIVDFWLDKIQKDGYSKTPAEKASAARSVLNTVSSIKDPVERNLMIKEITEKLGVDENLLIQQLRNNLSKARNSENQDHIILSQVRDPAEEGVLRLLLENPEKWNRLIFQFIKPEFFEIREHHLLIKELYEAYQRGNILNVNSLMNRFVDDPATVQCLARLMAEEFRDGVNRTQFGLDCLLNIHQRDIRKKKNKVREEIRSAQKKKEDVTEFSKKWIDLNKTLEKLRVEITSEWKKRVEF